MGLNYQKYINRLKQKRQDNPEYALYKQSMQAMAEPMKAMNRSMQGQMSLAGGSIGAIGSTYLQGQAGMQNLAMQSFGQADRAGMARNDALDSQIMQMEMTRDAEEERKKNELTKSLITGAATIGGFALGGFGGAILGGAAKVATDKLMPTPGGAPEISPVVAGQGQTDLGAALANSGWSGGGGGSSFNLDNAMRGAQIGAGIGGIGSSFVGGADYSALQQSIGDTLAGISAISTLKTHRQFLDTFREKYPLLNTEADKETLLTLLTLGDYQGAMNLLQGLQAPTADAEAIDTAEPVVADVANDPADPAVTVTNGAEPTQETKTTDEEQDGVISTPAADEINASVMDSHKTVSKDAFVAARKKAGANPAYDAMFDYMEKNGLAYDSPAMKKWVEGKYKAAGTYNRFKKIYKAAGGGGGKTTAEQTPVVKPKEETKPPAPTAEEIASMTDEELDNTYQQLKKNAAEGAAPRESATYGDSNAALGVKPGNYKVGKGQQFSRNTKTGELVVKVNGSYYKVRVNGNTIKVKVGDTVTVGADGKVEVK
jgi:hypothetical protein